MEINTNAAFSQSGTASTTASTAGAASNTSKTTASTANNIYTGTAVGVSEAAVYEKSTESTTIKKYNMDADKVKKMMSEMESKESSMVKLLQKLLTKQAEKNAKATGGKSSDALNDLMNKVYSGQNPIVEVDEETRLAAAEAVGENGYYGVKQTSERIVEFAKALTGGDPSKVEEMRRAIKKGFGAAADEWGSEMPQITQDTYNAVMKGLDEWAATANNK